DLFFHRVETRCYKSAMPTALSLFCSHGSTVSYLNIVSTPKQDSLLFSALLKCEGAVGCRGSGPGGGIAGGSFATTKVFVSFCLQKEREKSFRCRNGLIGNCCP